MNNLMTHFWSTFSLTLGGSQATSCLTFPSMMQPLCYLAFTFLCGLSLFFSVLSIQCDETQYPWPVEQPKFCCNKCPPGTYLVRRFDACQTQCEPCVGRRYRDTYNEELTCDFCENCDRPNMEYESLCNSSRNARCRCKAGYECTDQPCKQCLPTPTTKPTLPPSTTDTVWSLVVIGLLSAGIAFILVTKIKPFLHWIRSKHGYLLPRSHAPMPEDEVWSEGGEGVCRPVQEAGNETNLKIDPELGLPAFS